MRLAYVDEIAVCIPAQVDGCYAVQAVTLDKELNQTSARVMDDVDSKCSTAEHHEAARPCMEVQELCAIDTDIARAKVSTEIHVCHKRTAVVASRRHMPFWAVNLPMRC